MADVTTIANEIRKHIAAGTTEGALIAMVAHLADLFPDMTDAQFSAALQEAFAEINREAFEEGLKVARSTLRHRLLCGGALRWLPSRHGVLGFRFPR
jgi:hypothetical protein